MGKVHRAILSRLSKPARAVFVDTPAGFELNVDDISAKAVEYFAQRLNSKLNVVSFKSAATATQAEVELALNKLAMTNYVFAGPGSPTYVINNWRDSVIWEAITRRFAKGAHLVLASAAAIAVGRCALPVYEIFKAGHPPHWVRGLDLLGPYGFDLAIIPHWNNLEGGSYDTRYCFMGQPRMKSLEQRLPLSTSILGIDEYSACILDLAAGQGHVMGAGQVTLRHADHEMIFPSGACFSLGELKRGASSKEQAPTHGRHDLELPGSKLPSDWDAQPDAQDDDWAGARPFIDLLVEMRGRLRAREQWELADEVRERLAALGVSLEDGPAETTWR
jgi:cyanophycinase-like exopeptidase